MTCRIPTSARPALAIDAARPDAERLTVDADTCASGAATARQLARALVASARNAGSPAAVAALASAAELIACAAQTLAAAERGLLLRRARLRFDPSADEAAGGAA